jgi:hypothetical protein
VSCGLRDVLELESLGTPAVLVASDAFVQAADDQSTKLGQPAIRRTFVTHPVQDRTDEELRAAAAAVFDDVLVRLTTPPDE